MGKLIPDEYLDKIADAIIAAVTHIYMVDDSATPTDISGTLGNVAVGSGDWTKSAGDTSGRKLTLATQNITATTDGQKRYIVGWDGSAVVFATPVTVESIANGNIYEIPAIDIIEVRDPA